MMADQDGVAGVSDQQQYLAPQHMPILSYSGRGRGRGRGRGGRGLALVRGGGRPQNSWVRSRRAVEGATEGGRESTPCDGGDRPRDIQRGVKDEPSVSCADEKAPAGDDPSAPGPEPSAIRRKGPRLAGPRPESEPASSGTRTWRQKGVEACSVVSASDTPKLRPRGPGGAQTGRGRGGGRGHGRAMQSCGGGWGAGPGAKRIRINRSDGVGAEGGAAATAAGEIKGGVAKVGLTDFAYRATSTSRSRRKGGRGGRDTVGHNMGLIRVRTEEQKIVVCPMFARGLQCVDVRCLKRHDVPAECVTPHCSFFQRHGQCTRRKTCPFLHIKIDPRAEVCPSFTLLGYCEDKACPMRHMRK